METLSHSPECSAYMALARLLVGDRTSYRAEAQTALAEIGSAIELETGMPPARALEDDASLKQLVCSFDLDPTITYSDAWSYWDAADSVLRKGYDSMPLDQQLFLGHHAGSPRYFEGIHSLALRNADDVARWMKTLVLGVRCLDVGAGTGAYALAFRAHEVFEEVVCVDYPYMAAHAPETVVPGTRWIGQDVLALDMPGAGPFDAIWISNVLHHYGIADCARILSGCASLLRPSGSFFIHEYVLRAGGRQSLAAALLGLHFTLTTKGGRCYSRDELLRMASDSLGPAEVSASLGLQISTVLRIQRN